MNLPTAKSSNKLITACHQIIDYKQDNSIKHNLFLGSRAALNSKILKTYQIQSVVTVVSQQYYQKFALLNKIRQYSIHEAQHHLFINTNTISQKFDEIVLNAVQFIHLKLQYTNILVYCETGVSYSAFIVACYLIRRRQMSAYQAKQLITQKRYVCVISGQLWQILRKYAHSLHSQPQKLLNNQTNKDNKVILDPPNIYSQMSEQFYFFSHIISLNQTGLDEKGHLFLGDIKSIRENWLLKFRISAVLSLLTKHTYQTIQCNKNFQKLGIRHKLIDIKDSCSVDIRCYFEQSINYIDDNLQKGNVLVHCKAGRSRSASIVIAYLMHKFKASYSTCLNFVQYKRQCISPNTGFQQQLLQYTAQNQ